MSQSMTTKPIKITLLDEILVVGAFLVYVAFAIGVAIVVVIGSTVTIGTVADYTGIDRVTPRVIMSPPLDNHTCHSYASDWKC